MHSRTQNMPTLQGKVIVSNIGVIYLTRYTCLEGIFRSWCKLIILFWSFQLECCKGSTDDTCPLCSPCFDYLKEHGLGTLKNAVGGIGLFFSLMMVSPPGFSLENCVSVMCGNQKLLIISLAWHRDTSHNWKSLR